MIEELKSKVAAEAEKITAAGQQVRERISKVTADAMVQSHLVGAELLGIVQAVRDGAARGVHSSMRDESESHLREVIDGIVDGVSLATNAVNLSVEESIASGKRFASEDLKRAEEGLRQVQGSLAETLGDLGDGLKGNLADQAKNLNDHASSAVRQAGPVFVSTLETLARHAPSVASEATRAGAAKVHRTADVMASAPAAARSGRAGSHHRPRRLPRTPPDARSGVRPPQTGW